MAPIEQRTVEDLRQNAERTRFELAGTVGQLRSKVSETVEDLQNRISPDALKSSVGEYVRNRGDALFERARQNPLAAAAIAAGLAYPAFRLVRSVPGPVFLIGSGLFLMGSPTGQKVNAATKSLAGSAIEKANAVSQGLRGAGSLAADRLSRVGNAASSAADAIRESSSDSATHFVGAAVGLSGAVSAGLGSLPQHSSEAMTQGARAVQDTATNATATVFDAAHSAVDHGKDVANQLRTRAMDAPRQLSDRLNETVRNHPVLVGSVALGAGMFLASALPRSNIERVVAGGVADAARLGAAEVAAQGFRAARSAASAVISEVADGVLNATPDERRPESEERTVADIAATEDAADHQSLPREYNDAD